MADLIALRCCCLADSSERGTQPLGKVFLGFLSLFPYICFRLEEEEEVKKKKEEEEEKKKKEEAEEKKKKEEEEEKKEEEEELLSICLYDTAQSSSP